MPLQWRHSLLSLLKLCKIIYLLYIGRCSWHARNNSRNGKILKKIFYIRHTSIKLITLTNIYTKALTKGQTTIMDGYIYIYLLLVRKQLKIKQKCYWITVRLVDTSSTFSKFFVLFFRSKRSPFLKLQPTEDYIKSLIGYSKKSAG